MSSFHYLHLLFAYNCNYGCQYRTNETWNRTDFTMYTAQIIAHHTNIKTNNENPEQNANNVHCDEPYEFFPLCHQFCLFTLYGCQIFFILIVRFVVVSKFRFNLAHIQNKQKCTVDFSIISSIFVEFLGMQAIFNIRYRFFSMAFFVVVQANRQAVIFSLLVSFVLFQQSFKMPDFKDATATITRSNQFVALHFQLHHVFVQCK